MLDLLSRVNSRGGSGFFDSIFPILLPSLLLLTEFETRRVTRLIRSHSRFEIRQGGKGVRRKERGGEKGLAALAERKFITTLSRPLERCSLIFYQRRPSLFSSLSRPRSSVPSSRPFSSFSPTLSRPRERISIE